MTNHSISTGFYITPELNYSIDSQPSSHNNNTLLAFTACISMASTISPSTTQRHTIFQMGLAAAKNAFVGLSGFASHSKRKLRRWTGCYGSRDHEPVIHLQNDMTMMIMNNGGVYEPDNGEPSMLLSGDQRRGPLWQKNILMGGKCQLPDFSGVILYDSDGLVVPPAKNSLPLLTWK